MSRMVIVEGNNNDKDNVRVIMVKGEKGYSAYDLYVKHGGTLTEEEWLDAFLNANNFYDKTEIDNLLDDKADNSTTLAGYGITDAYTKSETDDLLDELVNDSYSTSNTETYSANFLNPVTLFTSQEGEAGDLTLNDDIGNYRYYEIVFSREGRGFSSMRLPADNTSNVSLITSFFLSNILRFYVANITILGSTLLRNYTEYVNITSSVEIGADVGVFIYKVIGYK